MRFALGRYRAVVAARAAGAFRFRPRSIRKLDAEHGAVRTLKRVADTMSPVPTQVNLPSSIVTMLADASVVPVADGGIAVGAARKGGPYRDRRRACARQYVVRPVGVGRYGGRRRDADRVRNRHLRPRLHDRTKSFRKGIAAAEV